MSCSILASNHLDWFGIRFGRTIDTEFLNSARKMSMLKQILKTWLPSIVRTTSGSCPYLRQDYRFYMLVFGGIAKSVKIIDCTEIHTPNLARDLEIFVRTYALRCCVHATITSRASLHCVIHIMVFCVHSFRQVAVLNFLLVHSLSLFYLWPAKA